jgi:hypothetical protein
MQVTLPDERTGVCRSQPAREFRVSFQRHEEGEHQMAKISPAAAADRQLGREQTSAVDRRPTWRPLSEQMEIATPHQQVTQLPALGYPISEDAVSYWFQQTFNRTPDPAEVGVVIDAMVRRDAEQPAIESRDKRVFHDR